MALTYEQIRGLLEGERLPALIVDLDAFDRNLERLLSTVAPSRLPIRVATKSLRIPLLVGRLLDRGGRALRGLMCFAVPEAELLAENGFDDLFIAYPTMQKSDAERLADLAARGTTVCIAVDAAAQLERLSEAAVARGVRIRVVLCADMSLRLFGDRVHLGVRRSPIATIEEALAVASVAARLEGIVLVGLMGYEAQVAGLADGRPGDLERWAKRSVRRASVRVVRARRNALVCALREAGHELTLINGGGTGSLDSTSEDRVLTEVTCGSAFFKPHAFDHFTSPHVRELEPACFFALEVTRRAGPGYVTCAGGGYVASGPAGATGAWTAPLPWLPAGLELLPAEMAGEVQTPLRVRNAEGSVRLAHGDPVVFRHAKAGEVTERFAEALLVQDGRIVDRAPTYRGMGACFV